MAVGTQPKPVAVSRPPRPELRVIESKRRGARLHLVTYILGNAVFWMLWAAVSISAEQWYWWPIVPIAAWTIVLAVHLWQVHRLSR